MQKAPDTEEGPLKVWRGLNLAILLQLSRLQTLNGVFIYSPPPQNDSRSALIVHAFTNKSAFLECLWTWNESLSDLLKYLPSDTEVLLLSLDDTALQDALWMREQVYRAAAHGYWPLIYNREYIDYRSLYIDQWCWHINILHHHCSFLSLFLSGRTMFYYDFGQHGTVVFFKLP